MIERYYLQENGDGSCNIIVYVDRLDAEFSFDFLNGNLIKKVLKATSEQKRNHHCAHSQTDRCRGLRHCDPVFNNLPPREHPPRTRNTQCPMSTWERRQTR